MDKLSRQMKDQNIFLNTHPGGVGFYNQKGFRRNKTALLLPAHEMPDEIKKGFCLPRGYRFSDESLKSTEKHRRQAVHSAVYYIQNARFGQA